MSTRDLRPWWPRWLPDRLRQQLEASYDGPARGYHDLRHLAEVLAHLDDLIDAEDPAREAVVLAAWFHDAVYDGRGDDERRSADLARHELLAAGSSEVLAGEVARLVRLTADHRPEPGDRAAEVLCDADLAILAADAERYAAYVSGVRREYASLSDADFARGRIALLQDLVAKPSLFHTEVGRRRWERAARANAAAEIEQLRRTLPGS